MDEGAKAQQIASHSKLLPKNPVCYVGYHDLPIWKELPRDRTSIRIDAKKRKAHVAGYDPDQIERFSAVAITAFSIYGVYRH